MGESDVVVGVEGLGKRYVLGATQGPPAVTLRDALAGAGRSLRAWLRRPWRRAVAAAATEFWALSDVSFEVRRGEVIGIVGSNGAGKSTLLKLLSRVTSPTTGRIALVGRVASLLEVGTGFHPELTGRENVFLNGALLGMTRAEIKRKFPEIVAFAELERFIDTPVKRYSSGMYVRLAFAVAAHLEPEILIIDEVLAVGDAAFQKRCLGKIGDVVRDGRTVLFVSHNMAAVSGLCRRALVMDKGRLAFDGSAREGVERYMLFSATSPRVDLTEAARRVGPGKHGRFVSVALFDAAGRPSDHFAMGDALTVELEVGVTKALPDAELGLLLDNAMGTHLHLFLSSWEGLRGDLAPGRHVFRITVPKLVVYPGNYSLTAYLRPRGEPVDDEVSFAIWFSVLGADLTGHKPDFDGYADNVYASRCETYCKSDWSHRPPAREGEPREGEAREGEAPAEPSR